MIGYRDNFNSKAIWDLADDTAEEDELEGQCLNCHGPSEGETEIIDWDGNDRSYFCGPDCRIEYMEEEE